MNHIESELQRRLLLVAPTELPDLRLFRRNILTVRIEGRAMRAGIKGQCDLYGYVRNRSRVIEIELKSATGSLDEDQRRWKEFCEAWGVQYLLLKAKKNEPFDAIIQRWIQEVKEGALAGV